MELGAIAFYVVAAATLVASIGVVTSRNVVYSALLLILTLSLSGLIYLLLLADFLALVQILIYGGTVSVLLLFALMLTRPQDGVALNHRGWPLAALGGLLLLVPLVYGALATDWSAATTVTGAGPNVVPVRIGLEQLGTALFSTWAVPFEIASLVLLVALLGALQVARSAGPFEPAGADGFAGPVSPAGPAGAAGASPEQEGVR
jgi:NADH:ubiquinone oxidoreductase subunit 6 (subunit J)